MIRWLQRILNRFRYLGPSQFVVTVDNTKMLINLDEPRGWKGINEPDLLLLNDVLVAGTLNLHPQRPVKHTVHV